MGDVTLGVGDLGGRGVYAARDFVAGEVVLIYRLKPLEEPEYVALLPGDDLFVHSFEGRRFLYPAPACFVNHAEDPSCFEDFDRCCYVAQRSIAKGEPVTIDAREETTRELATFFDAYHAALLSRSARLLQTLVDHDATLWRHGQASRGRDAVVAALIDSDQLSQPSVTWLVGTGRWEALGSVETAEEDRHHLTILLKVVAGNWQLLYQHTG